jgi:hypothetical protein
MSFRRAACRRLLVGILAVVPLVTLSHAQAEPTDWVYFDDEEFRVEADGNLSCYTENNRNCVRYTSDYRFLLWGRKIGLAASPDPSHVGSAKCGADHARRWGGHDGYQQPDHWCNRVYATLFAKWEKSPVTDGPLVARTPTGEVMCYSTDGQNCSRPQDVDLKQRRYLKPLICGSHHASVWGVTGYDQPGHWCAKAREPSYMRSPFG